MYLRAGILVFVLGGVLLWGGRATAQYPPPVGSLTATASNPSLAVNSTTVLTCHVLGADGVPLAGATCNFEIAGQPGSDAQLFTAAAETDATGSAKVTLAVGTTPGLITVRVTAGALETTLLVQILGIAVPPAAPLDVAAPRTGDGGLL